MATKTTKITEAPKPTTNSHELPAIKLITSRDQDGKAISTMDVVDIGGTAPDGYLLVAAIYGGAIHAVSLVSKDDIQAEE